MFGWYRWIMREIRKRMTVVEETMDLSDASEAYAKGVCKMNGWPVNVGRGFLSDEFVDVSLAFMAGYIKSMRDNGLEFKEGLVTKRDIAEDMPSGALKYHEEEIRKRVIEDVTIVLKGVLSKHSQSLQNVNHIMKEFKERLEN